jgi:integral membrane protein
MATDPVLRFRRVAFYEGVSFLVLLGIAMPLKYLGGFPLAVRVVGLAHGLLFLWYVFLVAGLYARRIWTMARVAEAAAASVIPFGTFLLDRRLGQAGKVAS